MEKALTTKIKAKSKPCYHRCRGLYNTELQALYWIWTPSTKLSIFCIDPDKMK